MYFYLLLVSFHHTLTGDSGVLVSRAGEWTPRLCLAPLTPAEAPPPAAVTAPSVSTTPGSAKLLVPAIEEHLCVKSEITLNL